MSIFDLTPFGRTRAHDTRPDYEPMVELEDNGVLRQVLRGASVDTLGEMSAADARDLGLRLLDAAIRAEHEADRMRGEYTAARWRELAEQGRRERQAGQKGGAP